MNISNKSNSDLTPVHVLTGFLGSGKTTLLNAVLKHESFANSAVIINEFGEVGLDHHLIETADDTIIELSNGCLCCTVRGQLIETLEELLERNPERILIETTGLADPVPVMQALIASPIISDAIRFSGLFTVVDAGADLKALLKHKEAALQIQLADRLILSKTDQLEAQNKAGHTQELINHLAELNPSASIIVKPDFLENIEEQFKAGSTIAASIADLSLDHGHNHHHHDVNRHSASLTAVQLTHDQPIERFHLDMFLDLLLSAHAAHVLRIKGLANIKDEARPLVIQGVGSTLSEPYFLERWPSGETSTSLTVFVDGIEGEFIKRLFAGFINAPGIDAPDRAALTENPLSIPGFNPKS